MQSKHQFALTKGRRRPREQPVQDSANAWSADLKFTLTLLRDVKAYLDNPAADTGTTRHSASTFSLGSSTAFSAALVYSASLPPASPSASAPPSAPAESVTMLPGESQIATPLHSGDELDTNVEAKMRLIGLRATALEAQLVEWWRTKQQSQTQLKLRVAELDSLRQKVERVEQHWDTVAARRRQQEARRAKLLQAHRHHEEHLAREEEELQLSRAADAANHQTGAGFPADRLLQPSGFAFFRSLAPPSPRGLGRVKAQQLRDMFAAEARAAQMQQRLQQVKAFPAARCRSQPLTATDSP